MIKGYARALDGARVVHAFAALALELELDVWFEYVRSAANIADLPSREFVEGYGPFEETPYARQLGSKRVEMVVPPLDQWAGPFTDWITATYAEAGRRQDRRPSGRRRRQKRSKRG